MLSGSEGGKSWSSPEAAGLIGEIVDAGLTVFSLAYFGIDGLPPALANIPLEYFEAAFIWLAEQPEVVPNAYALVGGSKGGELALLLGSRYSQVKAVAAFVPGSVVFEGLSWGSKSSWTHGGKELAYVPFSFLAALAALKEMRSQRFLQAHAIALRNTKAVEKAAIPVENIRGPVLLISGTKDQMWPSTQMCEQMMARLSDAHFPFSYQHLALETSHGVILDERCWPEIVRFLTHQFLGILAP